MDVSESKIHQVFVKLLDGKHRILNFDEPLISVSAIKGRIQALTSIPAHLQLLLFSNSRIIHDQQILDAAQFRGGSASLEALGSDSGSRLDRDQHFNRVQVPDSTGLGKFPVVVHLLLRLRGGKGGFGSLLRGAATKAGQKKTNNFDACRDMSGRRLRHVNAEKKLEEWKAEAEERRLEKMAEEFIKKKAKEVVKSGKSKGGDGTEKYVAKYREDSARCMEEVERSVRESVRRLISSKRKNQAEGSESTSKRLKIWFGKRKMGDSDSEDLDEEDSNEEEENDKSVIMDDGSHSDTSKEAGASSGSINDGKLISGPVDQGSSESGSEEVDKIAEETLELGKSMDGLSEDGNGEGNNNSPQESFEENRVTNDFVVVVPHESRSCKVDEMGSQHASFSVSEEEVAAAEVKKSSIDKPVLEEAISVGSDCQNLEMPLNFDEYHSAVELEVLGLERLKSELQARGLKCGGSLHERAIRLFLLKTTPLEMLPRKLFAKK